MSNDKHEDKDKNKNKNRKNKNKNKNVLKILKQILLIIIISVYIMLFVLNILYVFEQKGLVQLKRKIYIPKTDMMEEYNKNTYAVIDTTEKSILNVDKNDVILIKNRGLSRVHDVDRTAADNISVKAKEDKGLVFMKDITKDNIEGIVVKKGNNNFVVKIYQSKIMYIINIIFIVALILVILKIKKVNFSE